MRIANHTLSLSSTDLAQASITSEGIWLGHVSDFSIQIVFTGAPVGSFKLQASNDEGREDQGNGGWNDDGVNNWSDVSSTTIAISAAGDFIFNYANSGFRWFRVVYTRASGTGTITVARYNTKGI